ncbi:MAG: helix-turn-helix transcriptional regulator [Acidobacteria bacterium]|nr:helix-turn-helix transcriptional regulator [Acidobacteriota bacterium]
MLYIDSIGRSVDWTEIAVGCGYYDQSHLIRDFKRFTGHTPEACRADGAFPHGVANRIDGVPGLSEVQLKVLPESMPRPPER